MTEMQRHAWDFATVELYEREVMDRVKQRIAPRLTRIFEAGAELPDPDLLVDVMSTSVPDIAVVHSMPQAIGHFYSSAGVMKRMKLTKQALKSRRDIWGILAMRTSDDVWVYPVFQFDELGNLRQDLRAAVRSMKDIERWTAALWFVSRNVELGRRTPLEALAAGEEVALVTRTAAIFASGLRRP
jgi:hypothetical protein